MIEIELFYKTVEAKIREEHTDYLESEKRERIPIELPKVEELPAGDDWNALNIFVRIALKRNYRKQMRAFKKAQKKEREIHVEDKLLKGYNSGIKKALHILRDEFKIFDKRLEDETKTRCKY